ncbi:hypothetical protein BJY24_003980 [Nocardia transvalensis]|uniref:Uncharacterized protein n=1 Tax=Nocardia transvalensis TaxID=37333 RepID=A0A7W9PGD1_9NOCA|nr:hypothetical protein [Nocardia transvalensis]MBB5915113.1 hypothetical protein [Nocardia transvalensis]
MTDAIRTTAVTTTVTSPPRLVHRVGILDVTREYGITAVYERIAQLRASGQRHAALAIEQELRDAQAVSPGAA